MKMSMSADTRPLSPASLRVLLAVVGATLLGCETSTAERDDAGSDSGYEAGPARSPFGQVCEKGEDCDSGLCLPVAGNLSVCTERCEEGDGAASVCPDNDSWTCAGRDEEPVVCRCRADSFDEICADGVDNNCDGRVDDCQECGSLLVSPNDTNHCGDCGRRCVLGSSCELGQCVCDAGRGEACIAQPGDAECEVDSQCDDGIECTEDLCNVLGRCLHNVVPARCPAGEVCNLLRGGCQPGRACASAADCTDDDACTSGETCDPATRVCLWVPLDGDFDGQPPRVCGGTDCNDDEASTFSGATELCDGVDNNCDGVVDAPLPSDACPDDRSCISGSCQCLHGRADCRGECVDLENDEDHCGVCGNACVPGAACEGGQCVCGDGLTECTTGCYDLLSDDTHCGSCSRRCNALYQACEEGACVDIDECAEGTATCGPNSHCVNAENGYQCVCDSGYASQGGSCVDINECALKVTPCFDHPEACQNVEGGYVCSCPRNYEGDGKTCTCPAGYRPSGLACGDIDECAAGTDDCFDHPDACTNTTGGFTCQCPRGYAGEDGKTCTEQPECDYIDCGEHGSCVQQVDGFTCDCDDMYGFDGVETCVSCAGLANHQWCTDVCANTLTDPAHCGGCNQPCAGTCSQGSCIQ